MPLVLIISIASLQDIVVKKENGNFIFFLLSQIIFLLVAVAVISFMFKEKGLMIRHSINWAPTVATIAKNKIAMGAGSDILMMMLPDTNVGGFGLTSLYAPKSNLKIVYPGPIKDFNDNQKL